MRDSRERAILVGLEVTASKHAPPIISVDQLDYSEKESLEELASLAQSAGAEVLDSIIQARPAPTAATLIGSGKVQELAERVRAQEADVVIFDQELSPTQQRNLESALGVKVIDRTQLILDIFARRARTREGQLQVELAQLNYLLPRLTGRGREMSRLGGGIGTRGPGETQLETDRRKIFRRLQKIEKELARVRAHRTVQRKKRIDVPLATAALVGYTNAGKSTLFNRLTAAGVLADARMFATLDPTIRAIKLPSRRRVLLSDTVGFIRNLPPTLVKAFRATLEEVTEAALLLHVVDISSEHALQEAYHVGKVLGEIGVQDTPQLLILNKVDLVPGEVTNAEAMGRRLSSALGKELHLKAVAISAKTGQNIEVLLAAIDETIPNEPVSHALFRLPAGEGAGLHLLHQFGKVNATRYARDYCEVEAEVPEFLKRRLAAYLVG